MISLFLSTLNIWRRKFLNLADIKTVLLVKLNQSHQRKDKKVKVEQKVKQVIEKNIDKTLDINMLDFNSMQTSFNIIYSHDSKIEIVGLNQ